MKHDWEYKMLGEVCDVINGLWTGKKPPFVKIGVIRNTNFTKFCTLDVSDIFYTDVEEKAYAKRKLQKGDIIIEKSGGSEKQPVGRPILFDLDGEYSFSNFTSTLRINNGAIVPSFLHKVLVGLYFQGKTRPLQSKTTGIHNLDFNKFLRFEIPIPPLPIQQQIVAELDKVSEIIEKKKQQVKELDNLAQSIFYDMFGDPVENEKGWEVKKMGEVCQVVAGGDKPKDISEMRTEEYKYPVIANGEGKKGILGYSKSYRIADKSVTIGARGASIGNCRLQQEQFTPVVRLIVLTPIDDISCNYLYYYSKNSIFDINGAGQAQLTVPNVKSMSISLPPLSLQQSFAQKIEAIEKQKELITASIKEAQTLFDARMDYWFGE